MRLKRSVVKVLKKEDTTDDEWYDDIPYVDEKENVKVKPKKARATAKTETVTDEKENVLHEEIDEPELEEEKPEPVKSENEDKIIPLSHYWPYGMGIRGALEDKTLLYLYSLTPYKGCTTCPTYDQITELTRMYCYYGNDKKTKFVAFEDHPKELAKFMAENETTSPDLIRVDVVLRHENCPETAKCFSPDISSRSPLIKLFGVKERIFVYLKIDETTIPKIPKDLDLQIVYSNLMESYLKGELADVETNRSSVLADTFDFPEAKIPSGFNLTLRDYQLRTISWMKSIERVESTDKNTINHNILSDDKGLFIKFKLGETPLYLGRHFADGSVTESPTTEKKEPLRFYGGVLADNTGSGKTITTLGLIHSTPFTQEKQKLRMNRFNDRLQHYIQSRASCIICPSNIHKQWLQEAKKCNPKFKIIGLSNIYDHKKVSWKEIAEADIVVVSNQFLINSNYTSIRTEFDSARSELADFAEIKGRARLNRVHFHRIILDEFHEISDMKNAVKLAIESLRGDYYWGLTGTPKSDHFQDLAYLNPSDRLTKVCAKNIPARYEFIRKHIKRNVPNLELPPIENETVWIEMSAHELALLQLKNHRNRSTKEQIMMCSHYQLSEKESVSVEEFVPVEVAQKRMCKRKEDDIDRLKSRIVHQKAHIQEKLEKDPSCSVAHLEHTLKSTENELQSAQSSLNYFQSVFKAIGEPDSNECRICYDKIDESSLAILPCSHLFCYGCITPHVEKTRSCPLCRGDVPKMSDIFRIRITPAKQLPETLVDLDTSKYSSKLIGLYRYITELIKSDPNARIILFLQFSDLADFMAKSFKELKVECVRVVGTVFQRQNAITKFRDSKDIRLIMMSSEDSVSGINLTQATHVILLHPFWTGNGEASDLAYEKQGISRAYRFGLDHPLKIVRFAVRGSVEEEITLRHQNMKL